ncbi:hypothetical protein Pint_22987 [Pistacia integerrima]|uniref:Uncharacterized protein n=2 Tax=Pistacia TaxID=55512 RepID=A0ACC1B7N9_9ROSI|nr:hypothetical protein Pint_22987 [Pistacia integerrima]KAJ0094922.1 hypothetical protein Patl1_16150 [Pistacia atlantica]
MGYAFVLIGLS